MAPSRESLDAKSSPGDSDLTLFDVERSASLHDNPCAGDLSAGSSVWERLRKEAGELVVVAAPVVVQMATQQGMVVTDQVMVGHLGTDPLAAASLGNTWFNFWFYFMVGVATAVDTLGSQAYGAGDMVAYWKAAASSVLVLTVLVIPMGAALWCAEGVVHSLFQQPPHLAQMSGSFCKGLIPGLWPLMWGLVATKLLQTRNIVMPSAIIGLITFLVNIALNFVFIRAFGFMGCPAATTVSRIFQTMLTVVYLIYDVKCKGKGCEESWAELLREGLGRSSLISFLMLGLPGGVMLGLEATSFDISTALAGRLGTVAVDAHTVLLTMIAFSFMACPFGLGIAASIRVGSLLGSGDHKAAGLSSILAISMSGAFMLGTATFLLLCRHQAGSWFVNDQRVIDTVATLLPILVSVQVFDGVEGATQGVLRGIGKQLPLLVIILVGFWLCGLLPGYFLTFHFGLGLKGLWYGMASGIVSVTLISIGYLLSLDLEHESMATQLRIKELSNTERRPDAVQYQPTSRVEDDERIELMSASSAEITRLASIVGSNVTE